MLAGEAEDVAGETATAEVAVAAEVAVPAESIETEGEGPPKRRRIRGKQAPPGADL